MSTSVQNPGASAEAIHQHYDVSNEFFKLWLDPPIVYSCALWDNTDDLAEAQRAKIDFHIDQAEARGAGRVLDIGCGWGGALQQMVTTAGVKHAVGITLSKQQAAYIQGLGLPGVEVRVESWSDHSPTAPYDGIISAGAFEHFARLNTTVEEKIAGYRSLFQRCYDWLKPGGCFSLQTMCYENSSREDFSPFFAKEIFPESDLPRVWEIAAASDRLFEIVRLRNDREQYTRTSLAWRSLLRKRWKEASKLVGEDVVKRYDKYVSLWAIGFHTGTMGLLRIKFRKLDRR